MKDVKKRHLEETAAKKLEEKRLKEEAEQIKAEYEKWKVDWRDDLKLDEGMTTSGLYKVVLPAAGDTDSAEPTAANVVAEGGSIEMITDGGSTGAKKLGVTFVIRR